MIHHVEDWTALGVTYCGIALGQVPDDETVIDVDYVDTWDIDTHEPGDTLCPRCH